MARYPSSQFWNPWKWRWRFWSIIITNLKVINLLRIPFSLLLNVYECLHSTAPVVFAVLCMWSNGVQCKRMWEILVVPRLWEIINEAKKKTKAPDRFQCTWNLEWTKRKENSRNVQCAFNTPLSALWHSTYNPWSSSIACVDYRLVLQGGPFFLCHVYRCLHLEENCEGNSLLCRQWRFGMTCKPMSTLIEKGVEFVSLYFETLEKDVLLRRYHHGCSILS
jgi:hypothetical protein